MKIHQLLKFFFAAVLLCFFSVKNPAVAQLTVANNNNAAFLAQQLAGPGVAIFNATLVCPPLGAGTFNGLNSNLGINSGVILTSGDVEEADNSNSVGGAGANGMAAGDADLDNIIFPDITNDACVLEFDIQVNSDSLIFKYVFGSEEYPEFVNSFNDVFAFFISGPGIIGSQNIALLPGTTIPVSIDNVNNGANNCPGGPMGPCVNCQYYVDNCGGATVEYDGFTTVLTASAGNLNPCATYHLKLAVADANDFVLDSGVFLEAESFVAVNVTIVPTTNVGFGFQNAIEDCVEGIFEIYLDPPPVDTFTLNYQIGGTATNGVDYLTIADSITFLPGDTFGSVVINAIDDNIVEPWESVVLYLVNDCNGLPYDSSFLFIQDSIETTIFTPADTICRGEQIQLVASGGLNYNWSPGIFVNDSTVSGPIAQPDSSKMFYVDIAVGTCNQIDSVFITVIDADFTINATGDDTICVNEVIPLNVTMTGGQAPYTIAWTPAAGLDDSTIVNPLASPVVTTNYTVFVLGQNGCNVAGNVDVIVSGEGPRIIAKTDNSVVCPEDTFQVYGLQAPINCGISTAPCNGFAEFATIGDGSEQLPPGSPTQYPSFFGNWNNSAKHQSIYRASELNAAGFFGGKISSIAFNLNNVFWTSYENFSINIGCTDSTVMTAFDPNLQNVFLPKTVTIATGWNTLNFENEYDWDGVSNLIIEVCFFNPQNGNLNSFMSGHNPGYDCTALIPGGTNVCPVLTNAQFSDLRPDVRFNYCTDLISAQYDINWSPGSLLSDSILAVPMASIPDSTTFQVIASDPWCQGSNFVTVLVDTTTKVEAQEDTTICIPGPVQLNATASGTPGAGGWSYVWEPAGTLTGDSTANPVANPMSTTTYVVTLYGGPCIATDTVTIVVGGILFDDTLVNVSCYGAANGLISVSPTAGNPPFTYNWSNGDTTASIDSLSGGLYTLTITDSLGCFVTDTFDVFEADSIEINFNPIDLGCFADSSGAIGSQVTGGIVPYNYVWSNGSTLDSLTGIDSGSYNLTVTDSVGCTMSDSTSITQPDDLMLDLDSMDVTVNAAGDGQAWVSFAAGGTLPYTYLWSTGDNTDTISNLGPGCYTVLLTDANGCTILDSICITEPPSIVIDFVVSPNLCFGDSGASITAIATNAFDPYDFQWSTGATTIGDTFSTITGLSLGFYSVTVTDSSGVTATASTAVNDPPQLQLSLDTQSISCFGVCDGAGSAIVTGGTAPYTFTWEDGGTDSNRTDLCFGNHFIAVEDANGCVDSLFFSLGQPDSLVIVVTGTMDITCNGGSDGSIDVQASGGNLNYTYAWSNGSNAQNLNGVPAGNYTVVVTDANGCTDAATDTLSQPTPLMLTTSSTDANCFGSNDGTATVSATGSVPPYTFAWSGGGGTAATAIGLIAGSYTVSVIDANGCLETASVSIDQPQQIQLTFTTTDVSCNGGSDGSITSTANQGTPPYSFNWNNGQSGTTASGLVPGGYTVVVTDSNGCQENGLATIIEPAPLDLSIQTDSASCAGDADGQARTTIFGGSPPYTYAWSNGASTDAASNLATGIYEVSITDNNNCEITDTAFIGEPTPIQLFASTDSSICFGDSTGAIFATATGGNGLFQYAIDGVNFQEDNNFLFLPANFYTVTVEDVKECQEDTTVNVAGPPPFIINLYPQDTVVMLGTSVRFLMEHYPYTSEDIISYHWAPATGLTCTDCPNPTATTYQNEENNYTLTIKYANNCAVVADISIFVRNTVDFFIPNSFTPNGDGSNDVFLVFGERIKNVRMTIFNRIGEKIFESNSQSEGWDGTYKGKYVNPGTYVYRAEIQYLDGREGLEQGSITVIR